MLYEISVIYYNYNPADNKRYRTEMLVVGEDNARELGAKCMNADNVVQVDVVDALTGEVIESWAE